jgi:hypothetical protein
MKDLLPVVNPAIGSALEHELLNKIDSKYIKDQLSLIKDENPVISFWIENFSKKTRDRKGAIFCGLMVFRLLRTQAECDRMKEEIKL